MAKKTDPRDAVARWTELKRLEESLQRTLDREAGAREQIASELSEAADGAKTLEEGRKVLAKLEKELAAAEGKFAVAEEEFQKRWGEKLEGLR